MKDPRVPWSLYSEPLILAREANVDVIKITKSFEWYSATWIIMKEQKI